MTNLEDVVVIRDDLRKPVNATERSSRIGPYPYYGATGQVGWIDAYLMDGEYILLGEDGAPFLDPSKDKAYRVVGKSWVNNHAHVLHGADGVVDNRYLLYALNNTDYRQFANGTTRLKLTQGAMRKIPMPVAPIAEQRRIVARIEELFSDLDAGVAALKRAKANLRRYRAAVLKAAVEGKLTEEWSHHSFRYANWVEIGTLLTCLEQGWSPKCEREASSSDGEWAVIKTSAILPMQFLAHENKRLPIKLTPETQFEVKSGDLLITRAGPRNRAAVTCLVRSSRPRLIVCDKVYRIRCDNLRVMPAYLEVVLNSSPLLDELDEMKTGISDSGVNLTQQKFRRLKIPLPPLQIQRRIVDEVEERLTAATIADSEIDKNRLRAARLRQSILKQAFEGKLVPQDPADEPASVLLERLQANRSGNDRNGTATTQSRPRGRRRKSKTTGREV